MTLKGFLLVSAILICLSGFAAAENEFGIYGFRGTTNHEVLPNPLGVGVLFQADQSRLVALRLSYSWSKDSDAFISTIYRGGGFPMEGDTIRDLWEQDAFMNVFELSLLTTLIRNQDLSLALGPGVGFANFDYNVIGRSTGFKWGGESDFRLVMSLVADFKIAHSRLKPLMFHFFLRERISSGQSQCEDCARPFADAVYSTEVAVAISLGVH